MHECLPKQVGICENTIKLFLASEVNIYISYIKHVPLMKIGYLLFYFMKVITDESESHPLVCNIYHHEKQNCYK